VAPMLERNGIIKYQNNAFENLVLMTKREMNIIKYTHTNLNKALLS